MIPVPTAPDTLTEALRASLPDVALRLQPVLDGRLQLWLLDERAAAPLGADDARRVAAAPPYWSLCWAAGHALAAFLFEQPAWVAGKTVLDFGAGSGVVAIAAMRAGAAAAYAVDNDPVAQAACRVNAAANGVRLDIVGALDEAPARVDLVTVADVFYEPANLPLVPALRGRGSRMLAADSRRADLAGRGLIALGMRAARTIPDFHDPQFERVRLFTSE